MDENSAESFGKDRFLTSVLYGNGIWLAKGNIISSIFGNLFGLSYLLFELLFCAGSPVVVRIPVIPDNLKSSDKNNKSTRDLHAVQTSIALTAFSMSVRSS
ncbi:MAG: hypothetical protein ACR2PX_15560 [Endozoicomonas sp.]|uniref:hypothetical protein n=1 Tax=Endozoicomonas sp. TaxID=1892382 RepID=UPI003D9BA02B